MTKENHSVNHEPSESNTSDDKGDYSANASNRKRPPNSKQHTLKATKASNQDKIAANANLATKPRKENSSVKDDTFPMSASTEFSPNKKRLPNSKNNNLKTTNATNQNKIAANANLATISRKENHSVNDDSFLKSTSTGFSSNRKRSPNSKKII